MSTKTISSIDDLKKLLKISEIDYLFDEHDLLDGYCGFSIKKKYPDNILYQIKKTKDNDADEICMFHIIYNYPNKATEVDDPHKVSMSFRVTLHAKYTYKNFDYNYEDKDCPTQISVENSKNSKKYKPQDFNNDDEYYYNHDINKFVDKKNKYSFEELLEILFQKHIQISRRIKGIKTRSVLSLKKIVLKNLNKTISRMKWILDIGFGITLNNSNSEFSFLETRYEKNDMRKLKPDFIEFMGIKASKKGVILVSLITSIGYISFSVFSYYPNFIKRILNYNLLTLVFVILSLWIYESVIPNFFRLFLNIVIKFRNKILFSQKLH